MHLYGFTTETDQAGARIVRVSGCVADHPDPEARTVSIAFQVGADVPTVRNGALLRAEVLRTVLDTLRSLERDFQMLGEPAR